MTWNLPIQKIQALKIVGVLFSPMFLRKCLKKDILLDIMLYTGQRLQNVNKVPITFEYRQLLDDIFETRRAIADQQFRITKSNIDADGKIFEYISRKTLCN